MIICKPAETRKPVNSRSGIALVVVLGMLAIMVLMAVAFSISMRTERLAASAYVDATMARQLMDVAIARVLTEHIPDSSLATEAFYPPWDTYPTGGGGVGEEFLREKGIRYVPGAQWVNARNADIVDPDDWIDILDPTSEERFYGQYVYLVINSSGLLDANVVADSTRNWGVQPGEIHVRPLTQFEEPFLDEINMHPDADLSVYRDLWFGRFDSIPELHSLGSWNDSNLQKADGSDLQPPFMDLTLAPPALLLNSPPSSYVNHFQVFSHYPDDEYIAPSGPPTTHPRAEIGGDPATWSDLTIVNVLTNTPNQPFETEEDATTFLNLMKDYASETLVPTKLDVPSAKRVPMINEVAISNTVQITALGPPDTLTLTVHLFVETWFPFEYAPNIGDMDFHVEVEGISVPILLARLADGNPVDLSAVEAEMQLIAPPTSTQPISPRHDGMGAENDYRVTEFVYQGSIPVNCDYPDDPNCATGIELVGVEVAINGAIRVLLVRPDGSVDPVDLVQNWPAAAFRDSEDVDLTAGPGGPPATIGIVAYSAFDPRLNWDPQEDMTSPVEGRSDTQWDKEPATLGDQNAFTIGFQSDEFGIMHAALTEFRNVGELSYLLYSGDPTDPFQPWQTTRIVSPPGASYTPDINPARVIDRFTVQDAASRSGLVNINTPYPSVLQAALYRARVEPWQQTSPGRVSVEQAELIADDIVQAVANLPQGARNLSDLARLPTVTTETLSTYLNLDPTENNKFFAESPIRNSLGVLGTRDTLYTVFLMTRTFPRGFDPDPAKSEFELPDGLTMEDIVASEQRAVALVWRDPAIDENGVHQTVVVSFMWLPDFD